MSEAKRYAVLGQAQNYIDISVRPPGGRESPLRRTFDEAREALLPELRDAKEQIRSLPSACRLDEIILELRLDFQFLAKSYHPQTFLDHMGLSYRGSGGWRQPSMSSPKLKEKGVFGESAFVDSRSLFVSCNDDSLNEIESLLLDGTKIKSLKKDVIKIQHIHLPVLKDKNKINETQFDFMSDAIELVLYNWDARRRDQSVDRILSIVGQEFHQYVRRYTGGPTFLGIQATEETVNTLCNLNFLRLARQMPRVGFDFDVMPDAPQIPFPVSEARVPSHKIVIFDAGFDSSNSFLSPFVEHMELTSRPPDPEGRAHGTAVCSAALFGSINPLSNLLQPSCGILSFRVLPDRRNDAYELYGVIDAIEERIPLLPEDVRVINLSIGPKGPIDSAPSRFTYAIDRLSYDYNKLFFVAAGNTGLDVGNEGIQAPADSVNGVAVGAYTYERKSRKPCPAAYSSRGPGRSGAKVKPDVLAFGGCQDFPFYVLSTDGTSLVGSRGTSLAAPVVSSIAGEIFARAPRPISTQAVHALMINSATRHGSKWKHHGWGFLPDLADDIVACSPNRVTILYQGTINPKENWKLPFLLPNGVSLTGKLKLGWTIVFTPETDPASIDEYTLAGLELQFRPHKYRYSFSPPKEDRKKATGKIDSIELDTQLELDKVQEYLDMGWTQGALPVSDGKGPRHESILRSEDAKWDTIVRGYRFIEPRLVCDPCLTISVLGRGAWAVETIPVHARFAAALSVEAPDYTGDLYQEVLNQYPLLEPFHLRNRAEILVPLKVPFKESE